jgi:CubicO group peptidase (beta-lactamase class C family)
MTSTDVRESERSAKLANPLRRLRALLAIGLVFGLAFGTLAGLTLGPRTPALGNAQTGDEALAADVRAALGSDRGYQTLSAGRVRGGAVSFAGLGAEDGAVPTPQTRYEMGSIAKTFTGMLLADAVTRQEMALEDRLAQHLPELAGTPAGDLTLFELATHSSGLPPFPPDIANSVLAGTLGNVNPYEVSVERVIDASRAVELKDQGQYAYSNLGMSLLGHAEARAAGVPDWPTLATQRILQPLGMTATTFAAIASEIPVGALPGHKSNGWRAPHWYGPGFAPAGSGTWTTTEDLTRFATAILAGKAPGMAALEPEAEASNGAIGLAWQISDVDRREITWHNGGTGGMHTMLALDRERQQAVVLLGNTNHSADQAALSLAAADGPVTAVDSLDIPSIPTIALTLAGLWALVAFANAAVRGRDRLAVAIGLVQGAAGLLLLLAHGPWVLVPAWVWSPLAGVSVALAAYAVVRTRTLPTYPAKRRILRWLSAVANLIVLGFAIWTL